MRAITSGVKSITLLPSFTAPADVGLATNTSISFSFAIAWIASATFLSNGANTFASS